MHATRTRHEWVWNGGGAVIIRWISADRPMDRTDILRWMRPETQTTQFQNRKSKTVKTIIRTPSLLPRCCCRWLRWCWWWCVGWWLMLWRWCGCWCACCKTCWWRWGANWFELWSWWLCMNVVFIADNDDERDDGDESIDMEHRWPCWPFAIPIDRSFEAWPPRPWSMLS